MLYRIKIIDENTGAILVMSSASKQEWAMENGFSEDLYEVEKSDIDGTFWMKADASKGWTGAPIKSDVEKLDDAKKIKTTEVDSTASTKITSGFWYEDATLMPQPLHFSFDLADQSNFSSAMNGANLYLISQAGGQDMGVPSSIAWNGYKDAEHKELVALTFNATQFIQFWGYAETVHKNGVLTQARALKEAVEKATTIEEVAAIVWE